MRKTVGEEIETVLDILEQKKKKKREKRVDRKKEKRKVRVKTQRYLSRYPHGSVRFVMCSNAQFQPIWPKVGLNFIFTRPFLPSPNAHVCLCIVYTWYRLTYLAFSFFFLFFLRGKEIFSAFLYRHGVSKLQLKSLRISCILLAFEVVRWPNDQWPLGFLLFQTSIPSLHNNRSHLIFGVCPWCFLNILCSY